MASGVSTVPIEAGPFGSVVDAPDPKQARPTRLFDALNVYVPDPKGGSAVLARPGFLGLTTQLGTVDARTGQCVFTHTRLDATIDRITFGGGKMYRWDGATTFTDITPAGIPIDTANAVFCEEYNGEILINDEINKPWIYTPSTGAAETIELNDAHDVWAAKGPPVIYGGYPFFIIRSVGGADLLTEAGDTLITESGDTLITETDYEIQNTIAWGNPNDARTGYDQGDFDHLWTLTQAASELLTALYAEEGALVYLRTEGIGYITGAVEDDFRSAATREAIPEATGTDAPAALLRAKGKLWYVDLDGRVLRFAVGGGEPEELWYAYRRVATEKIGTAASRASVSAYARGAYHKGLGLVLFTIWDRQTLYAFDARTGKYVGTWSLGAGIHVTAMGRTVDSSNRAVFVILGTRASVYQTTDLGVFWREKFPDDAMQWLDQADAGAAVYLPLTRVAEPQWLAHKTALELRALTATASLVGDIARHANRLQYVVPGSGLSAALVAQSSSVVGEKSAADAISTAKWGFGKNAQGSAIRVRLSATHADNVQWGVHGITVDVQVTKARPRSK